MNHGFTSRWWGTFAQWRRLGGRVLPRPLDVPPGKWGTQIVFWAPYTKTVKDDRGEDEEERFYILRLYTVFNGSQVICPYLDRLQAGEPSGGNAEHIDYEPADRAIEATGATIRYGGDRAFYSPATDSIGVPPKPTFDCVNEFYATCFHELCHWSERRLDWKRDETDSYAKYELVAEIASCYICRELGVPASEDLSNHTSYLAAWLKAMRGDHRYIFVVSAFASKATDFILGFSRKPDDVLEPEDEAITA